MIISRDKSLLCPAFVERLEEFERELAISHLPFFLFMGLRTFEDQDELYAQGRTTQGKIVTNARGGDSFHNYGLACDYVLKTWPDGKYPLQWSWDTKADFNQDGKNDWQQMGSIAEDCGLEWGGNWKHFPDLPHVQCTFGLSLQDIKELYRIGGIKHIWETCK
jgi:peptidoglycan LD-endopeptidase CwlK